MCLNFYFGEERNNTFVEIFCSLDKRSLWGRGEGKKKGIRTKTKRSESCFTMALGSSFRCKTFLRFWPAILTPRIGVSWSILSKPSTMLEAKATLESTSSKNNGWASRSRMRSRQLGQFGRTDSRNIQLLQSIQKPCPVISMNERKTLFFKWDVWALRSKDPTARKNHKLVDREMRKANWTMSSRHCRIKGRGKGNKDVVLEEKVFI